MTETVEYVADAAKVAAQNDAFRRNACLAIPYAPRDPILVASTTSARSWSKARRSGSSWTSSTPRT